ncbi:unnamed protein product [Pelagomonas calceolata]|uniref:Uncharacterized protein n=1 Tax=Pelagomonas calceolata TaxID=35677 RepID=A0A8J2SY99_9STRA|nr:unnamed protein product [Pelagomonas calceolata]
MAECTMSREQRDALDTRVRHMLDLCVRLKELIGTYETDDEGYFLLDERGDVKRADAADDSTVTTSAAAGVRGAGSSVAVEALRLVLQHVCHADHVALSARPDAPATCFAVRYWERSMEVADGHGDCGPALTSEAAALKLCRREAHRMDRMCGVGYGATQLGAADSWLWRVQAELGTIVFKVVELEVHGGTIEDVVSYMDLRTLAALRVVVGPDESIGKLFNAVVTLRETKTPRVLHAVVHSTDIGFNIARVFKGATDAARSISLDCRTERPYPMDVLRLAAAAKSAYNEVEAQLFKGCVVGPARRSSKDYQHRLQMKKDIRRSLPFSFDVPLFKLLDSVPFDATCFLKRPDGAYDEDDEDYVDEDAFVAVRPLDLVAEVRATSNWGSSLADGVGTLEYPKTRVVCSRAAR